MQTPYQLIKTMVTRYAQNMSNINVALQQNPSGPQLTDSPLGFYITPEELAQVVKTVSTQPGFSQYLALFGADDKTGHLTVCLVGADAAGNILDVYKNDNSILAEEKWPHKTSITHESGETALNEFLNKI